MLFNKIFDKIYVINLKKSLDRRNHIIKEFDRVGIKEYEFIEAIESESEEANILANSKLVKKFPNCFRCNRKRCDCENNYLTPFQIGNWASFIKLFHKIVNENNNFVMICEDDIVFTHQYKRIIGHLLSEETLKKYHVDMTKPLLIRMGSAFRHENQMSNAQPIYLKNYALSNPCFAINKPLAEIYLKYLFINYHSDIYIHKQIPQNIKSVQHLTMFPYPVYELSFVEEKKKFQSLVRPIGAIRRLEYKEFLFITMNPKIELMLHNLEKILEIDIPSFRIGFHGCINFFLFLDKNEKKRYYFENKILFLNKKEKELESIKELFEKSILEKHKWKFILGIKEEDISEEEIYTKILEYGKENGYFIFEYENIDISNNLIKIFQKHFPKQKIKKLIEFFNFSQKK